MKLRTLLVLSVLALGACRSSDDGKDKNKDDKSGDTKATAEEKKAARPQPPPVDEGIDVPTEEHFEEAATAQIPEGSDLDKALDALEKEIDK
jgi:hypothetical protein